MILADTHIVLWLALEPEKLSRAATASLLEARQNGGGVSIADITLWEIAFLHKQRKLELDMPLSSFLRSAETAYRVLPMTAEIVERGTQFSAKYPKDPADRIIGATAAVHGLKLATKDRGIRASGEVPFVW